MEYKIEKGIPLPRLRSLNSFTWISEMEIGESVFVPELPETKRSNALYSARVIGLRLSSRTEVRDGVIGFRFWRVK